MYLKRVQHLLYSVGKFKSVLSAIGVGLLVFIFIILAPILAVIGTIISIVISVVGVTAFVYLLFEQERRAKKQSKIEITKLDE